MNATIFKPKSLNNTYDEIFKALFINNENVLAKMIEDITNISYQLLKDNIILETNEIPITRRNEKFKKCDFIIKLKNNPNYLINIELNTSNYKGLMMKNLSYIFSLFATSNKKGRKYNDQLIMIQINLNTYKEEQDELSIYEIRNIKNNNPYFSNLKIYSLDIVKCHKIFYNNANKSRIANYIKWGTLLQCNSKYEVSKLMNDILKQEEIEELESRMEGLMMDANGIMTKKEAKEWGDWLGRSMDYEDGIEHGFSKGTEHTNLNIIKSMLENKININLISKITGKSVKEIKKIKEDNQN